MKESLLSESIESKKDSEIKDEFEKTFIYVPQGCYAFIDENTANGIVGLYTTGIDTCAGVIMTNLGRKYIFLAHIDESTQIEDGEHGIPGWFNQIKNSLNIKGEKISDLQLQVHCSEDTDMRARDIAFASKKRGLMYKKEDIEKLEKQNDNMEAKQELEKSKKNLFERQKTLEQEEKEADFSQHHYREKIKNALKLILDDNGNRFFDDDQIEEMVIQHNVQEKEKVETSKQQGLFGDNSKTVIIFRHGAEAINIIDPDSREKKSFNNTSFFNDKTSKISVTKRVFDPTIRKRTKKTFIETKIGLDGNPIIFGDDDLIVKLTQFNFRFDIELTKSSEKHYILKSDLKEREIEKNKNSCFSCCKISKFIAPICCFDGKKAIDYTERNQVLRKILNSKPRCMIL